MGDQNICSNVSIIQNNSLAAAVCNRWFCSYLSHSKAALPAGYNLVPFVMQHVHEAIWLVLTNKLWDIGGEWRVLREANPIACQWKYTVQTHYSSVTNSKKEGSLLPVHIRRHHCNSRTKQVLNTVSNSEFLSIPEKSDKFRHSQLQKYLALVGSAQIDLYYILEAYGRIK